VRVRWSEERGRYVLIAGERRWRAAALAGLPTMTAIVVEGTIAPAELLAIQVTENLQREDLNPMERARAFRTLMDLNGWSGNQLAKELGISQPAVVQALKLLELGDEIGREVERGALAPTVAAHLAGIDDPDARREVAGRIVTEDLSRAEAIEAVKEAAGRSAKGGKPKGRGARAHKVTSRTFRTAGYKVTAENRRGVELEALAAALRDVLGQVEAEQRGRGEAA
jgi:ParB family chromosome partitioning protein